jgi:3-deoxy-D-manno-octulosonic-acid transferase
MYFLYSFFLGLALLLSAPLLLAHRKYRAGFAERLGRVPERIKGNPGNPNIWLHAVSVGEVLAVAPLVEELRRRIPASRLLVSTTTATGQALARQRFGERNVFFFPFDLPLCIAPYLRSMNPALVVTAETEFWPNLLRIAKRRGARMALVNGRISDRSLPGYRRWRLLLRSVLRNVDVFLAQTAEDARRLAFIGAPPERIQVSGNLKFDVSESPELPIVQELRNAFARGGATSIIVCGSTVVSPDGKTSEEELLLKAFLRVLQADGSAVMLLAPRKPERFDQVTALIERYGLPVWRRSHLTGHEAIAGGVVLLDSVGELASLYRLATVAFVGGSLVPAGGHNILEPAQAAVPVLMGPYTHNFRDMVGIFREANAILVVPPEPEALAATITELIRNPEQRRLLGGRAQHVFRSQAGATFRTADALVRLMHAGRGSKESQQVERAAR